MSMDGSRTFTDATETQGSLGTWRSFSDPATVKEFLASHIRGGFVSSAYWGVTGETLPPEPDDVAGKKPHCFEMEISRKLVPFPEDKTSLPRTLDYTLIGLHRLKEDATGIEPQLNVSQLLALRGTRVLGEGEGEEEGGERRRPRLLENTTTQNRTIGKGTFDPNVLDALQKGAKDVDEMTSERERLKGMPLECTTPDMYHPSSWDYCDMSGIDPSSYCVTQRDTTTPEDVSLPVYKSRYNLVEKEGPVRREKTKRMFELERNVDMGLLRDSMKEANINALPEGYQTWSANEWRSTTHDVHAPYDIAGAALTNTRHATAPLSRTYHTLTPAHEQTVLSLSQRRLSRHDGKWATEYSDSYMNRFDKAEVNKEHSKRSIFDVQNGIYTMHHSAHHPRADTASGETYTPSQIVPGQYTTMAMQPLHARNALS